MDSYTGLKKAVFYLYLNLVTDFMGLLQADFLVDYQMEVYVALASSSACS